MLDNDSEVIKKNLKDLFLFGIYKLDNNQCTPEELRSLERMAEGNLEMDASIKDIATFFGQSEVNVRSTINRKLLAKPKRKVLYPFLKFLKIAPESWRKKG